jgi:very-short-patch-repair endonuclease
LEIAEKERKWIMLKITNRVREYRQNSTNAEEILWQYVRDRRLGWKIVRQKPVILNYFGKKRAFVADFYCKEARMVIEIDGNVHAQQMDYDSLRTFLLNQKGLRLIRFTNDEVKNNSNGVVQKIQDNLALYFDPLSACGEGKGAKRQG